MTSFFKPHKYTATAPIELPQRQWPSRTITHAPIWLSTDLRDGNQALFEPMRIETKQRLFDELVRVGLREIEVGFPAASQIDFDFTRQLIEKNRVPCNVTVMVMCQMRKDLIERTVQAVTGAPRVIIHLYNATAPVWRDTVFNMTTDAVLNLIAEQVTYLKQLTDQQPQTQWILQYSPETFSSTELPFALAACQAALQAWEVSAQRPVIINLPTTVENATPNIFADQIEWMNTHLTPREHLILSVHTHNDRGTGVAAAELAQLAGAQRVEGCLFGNGERSGNVDLVTLALNLHTQGIDCGLDFGQIDKTAQCVTQCTGLPIHPRHPYVGDMVHTAFSGSHQDAIRKGFAKRAAQPTIGLWQVPYLPIDPADIGRTYQDIIRVNSQSGKGGIAFLLEQQYGITLPRKWLLEFSKIIQQHVDTTACEVSAAEVWQYFQATYVNQGPEVTYTVATDAQGVQVQMVLANQKLMGIGQGLLAAVAQAVGGVKILSFSEQSLGTDTDAQALAFIEIEHEQKSVFAAGLAQDTTYAAIGALLGAVQRAKAGKPV